MHDPTQLNRQGPDIGDNYRSTIFYQNEKQKSVAQEVINELNRDKFKGKIVTTLEKHQLFGQLKIIIKSILSAPAKACVTFLMLQFNARL